MCKNILNAILRQNNIDKNKHMLEGDLDDIDYSNIMIQELKESFEKYNLEKQGRNELLSGAFYSNGKCTIRFLQYDRRSIRWTFFQAGKDFEYRSDHYLEFIKNTKPNFTFDYQTLEDIARCFLKNFNKDLLDYMDVPMSGDFSWHGSYIKALKEKTKYLEFAFSTTSDDSEERRRISKMCLYAKDGWKEAVEIYFKKHYPDGGKEFEVGDIFNQD